MEHEPNNAGRRQRAQSHRDYLDSLHPPSAAERHVISAIQSQKEREILEKYNTVEDHDAARVIQRAYRGHRERRQLSGLTIDPSSRWVEAIKEWRYRNAVAPHRRLSESERRSICQSNSEAARVNWRRAGEIAEHAIGDSGTSNAQSNNSRQSEVPPADSMLLDLRYFLEMIDVKHRYGANLQVYHEAWRSSVTSQNFFQWLDHGAGRYEDLPGCSRAKLDKERIRYLSKEERHDYLVSIDEHGLLRWAKDGSLITTSVDRYEDSPHGIVLKGSEDSPATIDAMQPTHSAETTLTREVDLVGGLFRDTMLADSEDDSSTSSASSSPGNDQTPTQSDQHQEKKKKTKTRRRLFVSPATILNHLLRASVRPGTWIYVCDTVGRLYVGIKSSGAFQHASFLSGGRISSAGTISIEEGKLIYLSPLSGHYRPTTKSFRAFIASLKSQQADLSSLRVSKAYTVLLGMEVYGRSKKDLHKAMHPHEVKDDARKRGMSRASLDNAPSAFGDNPISATELIERSWQREHEPRGLVRTKRLVSRH